MRLSYLLLLFGLLCTPAAFSQNDTLVLANGDRIVGELKKMDRGIATIKTKYSSGDLKIKWKQVKSVKSNERLLISTSDRKRYRTTRMDNIKSDNVLVYGKDSTFIDLQDIVLIKSVEDNFLSRLSATISIGYNFTKASNLSQLSVASTLGYTSDDYGIGLKFNSVSSSQNKVDNVQRTSGELSFNYFLKRDRFLIYQSEFLSNSEQKLNLRVTNKIGFGKYFMHTNRMYLGGAIGVAWNNENYDSGVDEDRNSGEAYATVEINLFDIGDLSLLSGVTAYPSLTENDRVRIDYKLELKYDLPLDLFLKLGFNYNYDNKPVLGASYDDYVIQTTIGWEL